MKNHALAFGPASRIIPLVFALEDRHTDDDRPRWEGIDIILNKQYGPRALGYAPALLKSLVAADLDILHLHGIWMYPSACGAAWATRTRRPYVISPHGMLEPWITKRSPWKKAVARAAYEERSWRAASVFHALTEAEAGNIEAALAPLDTHPDIVTIPNGIAMQPTRRTFPPYPAKVVYLGRIHPKKNLEALVDAWRKRTGAPHARMAIAGWGEPAHVAAFEATLRAAADPSIAFLGPVYGQAKAALLEEARFLILPSLSEGMPMTVLEGWAAGTPCIMTAACNLTVGFAKGAAIETAPSSDGIAAALRRALALTPEAWLGMSQAAHSLVREHFASDAIAARWTTIYTELAEQSSDRRAPVPAGDSWGAA